MGGSRCAGHPCSRWRRHGCLQQQAVVRQPHSSRPHRDCPHSQQGRYPQHAAAETSGRSPPRGRSLGCVAAAPCPTSQSAIAAALSSRPRRLPQSGEWRHHGSSASAGAAAGVDGGQGRGVQLAGDAQAWAARRQASGRRETPQDGRLPACC
jgi:hypothetical protein